MDLLADLKKIVEQHLITLGIVFPTGADLETVMLLTLNHELKTVSQRPRKVHHSKAFADKKSGLDAAQQKAVADILAKFKNGEDVNGHLSKSSAKPAETDALLADWKIHHLHISNHKTNATDTFYARTGPVMFAHVAHDAVYVIDIYPHGKGFPETWTRQELLGILDKDWPHLLEPYRIKGITGLTFTPTDLDLKMLRGGKVNTTVHVGGSFIAPPGGGLASDGTPVVNVTRMDKTFKVIKQLETWVVSNSVRLKTEIASKSGIPESELDFELVPIDPKSWGVIEKKTQTLVARTS